MSWDIAMLRDTANLQEAAILQDTAILQNTAILQDTVILQNTAIIQDTAKNWSKSPMDGGMIVWSRPKSCFGINRIFPHLVSKTEKSQPKG